MRGVCQPSHPPPRERESDVAYSENLLATSELPEYRLCVIGDARGRRGVLVELVEVACVARVRDLGEDGCRLAAIL